MSNKNIQKHIEDTLIHKQLFNASCLVMVKYLFEQGRDEDAMELARRCLVHDNSKLTEGEIDAFIQLPIQNETCTKPHSPLTEEQKKLLELHWKNNRHHPEHFIDCHHMDEIDILEMCVDWSARSRQFNTNLIPYVVEQQQKRFNFDKEMFNKILKYCEVLMQKE